VKIVRVEGEGETKCKGTKRMGQNEWDEMIGYRNACLYASSRVRSDPGQNLYPKLFGLTYFRQWMNDLDLEMLASDCSVSMDAFGAFD
jgi:hypothetical protein